MLELIGWTAVVNGKKLKYPKDYIIKNRMFVFKKKPKKNSIIILTHEYFIK